MTLNNECHYPEFLFCRVSFMLIVTKSPYAVCRYAVCRYAVCRYAEYRGAIFMTPETPSKCYKTFFGVI